MKTGDNFKDFLKKNVPDHLKKKALRKLWLTNPIFGYLDGMNEYDEDFTLATSALEEFATNYVVGKGFKGQFKPEPDCTNTDILEDDTLKSSSVRLDEKSKELVNNEFINTINPIILKGLDGFLFNSSAGSKTIMCHISLIAVQRIKTPPNKTISECPLKSPSK